MSLWKKDEPVPEVRVDRAGHFDIFCPVCGRKMTASMEKLGFGIAWDPDRVHVMTFDAVCPGCRSKVEGKLRFPDLCVRVGHEEK